MRQFLIDNAAASFIVTAVVCVFGAFIFAHVPAKSPQPAPDIKVDCAPHVAAANSCDRALLSCLSVQVRVIQALDGVENELVKLREGAHAK